MAASEQMQTAHQHRINGEYDQAIPLYRQIIEANEGAAEAWWGLGLSLMNIGEFDEAIEALEHATKLDEANARFMLDLAKLYTMLGMYDEAKPFFEKIVEMAPGTREAEDAANQLRYY